MFICFGLIVSSHDLLFLTFLHLCRLLSPTRNLTVLLRMPTERSSSSLLSINSYGGRSSRGSTTTSSSATKFSQSEQECLKVIRGDKAALLLEIRSLKDEIADCSWIMERLDVDEDGEPNSQRQYFAIGRKKFNLDPRKGIEYLVEQKVLQQTSEEVAKLLFGGEGLTKTAIGVYLGEPDAFNQKVRPGG